MADETPPRTRQTKAERLRAAHQRAMERFDAIWEVVRPERAQSLSDRRFSTIRGAQWEGQYAFGDGPLDANGDPVETGLPRMEVPKFYRPMRRTLSEYRTSRKMVDFKPKGDSDKASADNLDGLYRADRRDSPGFGQDAEDNAFQEGIKGGFGAWRLRTRYEDEADEANERQRVTFEPIYDADQRVFFDLNDQSEDKSGSRFAFLLTPYTPDAFKEEFPDHDPATFGSKLPWRYDWVSPELVVVGEYYEVEDQSVLRRTFRSIATGEERTEDDARLTDGEAGDTLEDELLATGWEEVRQRRIKRQRVRKYLMSGAECLREEGIIAGRYIPIVPFYADRCVIDGIERFQGMIRPVIDPTRIYNMVVSGLAEAASGPASDTPILAPEQVPGNYKDIWARRNIDRPAYLPLEPIRDESGTPIQTGISGTLPVAQVAPNMAALIQVAGADILDIMGETSRPETVPSNTSAAAIEMVNEEADVDEFLWRDQFAKALMTSGRIWLEMAKDIYVEEGREMIAIDAKGQQSRVRIAEPAVDSNGARFLKNDLTTGSYDVEVDIGPATRTQQGKTVRSMLSIAQTAVSAQRMDWAAGALGVAILNMDGEGIGPYQDWIRQQGLRDGWVEPNQEERMALAEEQQNAQPDPQQMLVMAAAAQAQAEAQLAQSRTAETIAKAEQARAKTAEILAGIDQSDRAQAIEAARLLLEAGAQGFDQQKALMAPVEQTNVDAA